MSDCELGLSWLAGLKHAVIGPAFFGMNLDVSE